MRSAVLVLTCACSAALVASQTPLPAVGPPRDSRPAASKASAASDARVFGRVVDAETSRPLRGAFVLAVRQRLPDGTAVAERQDTLPPAATRTDADGRFALGALVPGEYTLVVRRSGYVQQQLGQASPSTPPRHLVVGPGAVAGPLEFALTRSAVISGRVLDAHGAPAERVTVRAGRRRVVLGVSRLVPGAQATTAASSGSPGWRPAATSSPPCRRAHPTLLAHSPTDRIVPSSPRSRHRRRPCTRRRRSASGRARRPRPTSI